MRRERKGEISKGKEEINAAVEIEIMRKRSKGDERKFENKENRR